MPTEGELHYLAERQQAHFEETGYCASPKQCAKWLEAYCCEKPGELAAEELFDDGGESDDGAPQSAHSSQLSSH